VPARLDDTVAYVKQRHAFGQPIAAFQNTQFKLAELATQVELGQAFVDKLTLAHVRGDDIVAEVSMAKWWTTDLQKRLTADCLQLHGGYGFMLEYPISMDYADAAVQSIYAGSNEIMKVIIARRMASADASFVRCVTMTQTLDQNIPHRIFRFGISPLALTRARVSCDALHDVPSVPQVSLREHRAHWGRALLVVAGIATGIGLIIAVDIINASVLAGFQRTFETLAGPADLEVTLGIGEVGFAEDVVDVVRRDRDVTVAVPLVRGTITLADDATESLQLFGAELTAEEDLARYGVGLASDRRAALAALNDPHAILVTAALAAAAVSPWARR